MFMGNNAVVGSAIYVNKLDFCSWSSYYPPYFYNTSNVFRWPFISYKYVVITSYVCIAINII